MRRSTMVVLAALTLSVSACGDEITDPDALLASEEAEAVMRSAAELPSLPELLARAEPTTPTERTSLYRAQELWATGAATDDSRGGARRRLAASYAAPILAEQLDPEEWADVRDRLEAWQTTAEQMLEHITLPDVDARLRAARRHLDRADEEIDPRTRALRLLFAASELVETTPRYVARTLTDEADAAVRRAESAAARASADSAAPPSHRVEPRVPEVALERARRLKDWAARAVQDGEHLLAIQRAYYAIQLVEGG